MPQAPNLLCDSADQISDQWDGIMVDSHFEHSGARSTNLSEGRPDWSKPLRIGAVCLVVGFVVFMVPASILHPQVQDANNMLLLLPTRDRLVDGASWVGCWGVDGPYC
jgi:hypothetical protein